MGTFTTEGSPEGPGHLHIVLGKNLHRISSSLSSRQHSSGLTQQKPVYRGSGCRTGQLSAIGSSAFQVVSMS